MPSLNTSPGSSTTQGTLGVLPPAPPTPPAPAAWTVAPISGPFVPACGVKTGTSDLGLRFASSRRRRV